MSFHINGDRPASALFSLTGKVAVVTGGSRGIGYAISDAFARSGARVVAVARSLEPDIPFGTAGVDYRSVDVTGDVSGLVQDVVDRYGAIDALVNAAGVTIPTRGGVGQSPEDFDETIRVNLSAVYGLCSAVRRHMRPGSAIINVTSIGSLLGFPSNPGYVAAKGAVRMMTKALAVDYGVSGIRVNALAPGYIRTAMTEGSFADPVLHEQRRKHTCLGRWGTAGDLVGAAIFLAADASAYMTGQDVVVDGGWTAKGLV